MIIELANKFQSQVLIGFNGTGWGFLSARSLLVGNGEILEVSYRETYSVSARTTLEVSYREVIEVG
jgi:hypothetical protein